MKRLAIRETPYSGSMVSIMGPEGERKLLERVTSDGSPKFNTVILYEPEDEIYEHWDAMYCWEEPETLEIKKRAGLKDYFYEMPPPPPLTFSRSILLDEMRSDAMRRGYDYKTEPLWTPGKPKLVIKNQTKD